MKNNLFRKGLVIGILFLFLVVGLVPSIGAIVKNDVKEDLSKSTSQSLWPPSRRSFVVGIMEVIYSNDFHNYLNVRVIFPIWSFGFMIPFKYYQIKNFTGYYSNYIVVGSCSSWMEIPPP
jgi:hypothetical protein